jgi:hypothetical protein
VLAWISLNTGLVAFISIIYLAVLFIIAHWGQRYLSQKNKSRPWIYSLSLGVSCTSWAFYGTVGQAANTGNWIAPVYIGSILCLVFAWPMLLKMLKITKQQNLTSIADFIACRYDRSPKIASSIAIIALLGTIPYIALQLRAISSSFNLITGSFTSGIFTTFTVACVLIVFSILFGANQISASKQNQGLVLAIAFSSIVKLLALTAVGIFATYFLFDGFSDLLSQQPITKQGPPNNFYLAIAQAILGAITIFILPQQFHMMMIENHHQNELKHARFLYPAYLIAINVFVLPIAIAGYLTFPGGSVDPDTYVLTLPLFYQQAWLSLVVYIGGLSAATSMVIIATIVLSTMLVNEVVNPLILKLAALKQPISHHSSKILILRRFSIAAIILLAFLFERQIDEQEHLANIGLLSFVLLAQFAPAAIGALYWRKASTKAAFIGLLMGSLVWIYTLLLPTLLPNSNWINQGPWQLALLKPTALFGLTGLDPVSHGVFFSLCANFLCFVVISLLSHRSIGEQLQAEIFLTKKLSQHDKQLSKHDLYRLLQRFINQEAAESFLNFSQQLNDDDPDFNKKLTEYTRLQLSGVLGSASTRMVMRAASLSNEWQEEVPLEEVVSIVDEASQLLEFNRELLQAGIENIEQGISIIDADMRLVAWNRRYIELLDYPPELVVVGQPIEILIRYNIERGIISTDNIEQTIQKRIRHMKQGHAHYFKRLMPNGMVLEIRGKAMPGGGFVSTFADITTFIQSEQALQKANENLESRVAERTQELANAKAEAEAANKSKTRFLAAASHDLMQPFNALSLFTSLLAQKNKQADLAEIIDNMTHSLSAAESLLTDLVDISKLDSGYQQIETKTFCINQLLQSLHREFAVIANSESITFKVHASSLYVCTDQALLRRILQNLLSNAFKYGNPSDKPQVVILGAKRLHQGIRLVVIDNGLGIPQDKQRIIFKEFERLEQHKTHHGLGLGLAICDRIAKLLSIKLTVTSTVNRGTCFSIELPTVEAPIVETKVHIPSQYELPPNMAKILVIDNDELVLKAITSLLASWQFNVVALQNTQQLTEYFVQRGAKPDLIIADYHLDNGENGVDVITSVLQEKQWQIPCIINSADTSETTRQHTSNANFLFLRKPLKPLALKQLLKKLLG